MLCVAVCLFSCERVRPEPPVPSDLDTLLSPPLSVIHVPVQYRVSEIQDLLNEKVKGTFVKKWLVINDNSDSLYLEVSRREEITLRRREQTLYYTVPLKITGKVKAKVAGVRIRNATPVEALVNLHMVTSLRFDKRWNLVAKSDLKEIEWVKEPVLKVAFVKVKLRKPIESVLENKESAMISKADSLVQRLVDTRKIAQKLWGDIQKPIRISKKGITSWLKVYGEDLSGHLEETEEDLISLKFELKARARIIYEGDSMPASNPILPPFKQSMQASDSLNIYVHSLIRYELINKVLEENVKGKTLSAQGFNATISGLRVYGTSGGIAVEVKVKGDVSGKIYARGTPAFDPNNNTFSVSDFDFDVESENSLISTADWLLHTAVLDLIKDQLTFNVEPLAARIPELITQGIEKGKTGQKIDLRIDTLHIQPQVILPTRDNIQVIANATGRASLVLEKKLFEKKKRTATK